MNIEMAAILAKGTAAVAFIVAMVSSLAAQLSDSATNTAAAASLAGLVVSSLALIKFLVTRATTDEGRSTEMWGDLRAERDEARRQRDNVYVKLEIAQAEIYQEHAEKQKWQNIAEKLRSEFRIRLGEEPASWPPGAVGGPDA